MADVVYKISHSNPSFEHTYKDVHIFFDDNQKMVTSIPRNSARKIFGRSVAKDSSAEHTTSTAKKNQEYLFHKTGPMVGAVNYACPDAVRVVASKHAIDEIVTKVGHSSYLPSFEKSILTTEYRKTYQPNSELLKITGRIMKDEQESILKSAKKTEIPFGGPRGLEDKATPPSEYSAKYVDHHVTRGGGAKSIASVVESNRMATMSPADRDRSIWQQLLDGVTRRFGKGDGAAPGGIKKDIKVDKKQSSSEGKDANPQFTNVAGPLAPAPPPLPEPFHNNNRQHMGTLSDNNIIPQPPRRANRDHQLPESTAIIKYRKFVAQRAKNGPPRPIMKATFEYDKMLKMRTEQLVVNAAEAPTCPTLTPPYNVVPTALQPKRPLPYALKAHRDYTQKSKVVLCVDCPAPDENEIAAIENKHTKSEAQKFWLSV